MRASERLDGKERTSREGDVLVHVAMLKLQQFEIVGLGDCPVHLRCQHSSDTYMHG